MMTLRLRFRLLAAGLFLVVALSVAACGAREPAAPLDCDSDVAELLERFGQLVERAQACDEDGGECRAFCEARRSYNRRFLGMSRACQLEFDARAEADPAHEDKLKLVSGKTARCRALGM
jgi:hypothetical protein